MPCSLQPWEIEIENRRRGNTKEQILQKKADELTAENDQLREMLLKVSVDPDFKIPKVWLKKVNADQVKHRKNDLKRLEQTFRKNKDAERLGKVILADPNQPLEEQLGFDPDHY